MKIRFNLPKILVGSVVVLLCLSLNALPNPVQAPAQDWNIPGGHFFTQTGGGHGRGFPIIDDGGARFWSEFQRFGGLQTVGYPISQRFTWEGFTVQAFQRVVMQWHPDLGQAQFVNVFDILSERGQDAWLRAARQIPEPAAWEEQGMPWDAIIQHRLAVLAGYPNIAAVYASVPGDPVQIYGLPVAPVTDMGNVLVLRTQRVVIQQWKEDVPWARQGQVTIANGGEIGREAGLYSSPALAATSPPIGPPIEISPGAEPGAKELAASSSDQQAVGEISGPGKIVFISNRNGSDDVFVMDGDGANQTKLTREVRSFGAALSPDGMHVAYDAATAPDKRSNHQVFIMSANGAGVKRLTNNSSEDWFPSWSPDGRRIAFFSHRDDAWGIWTMNPDGSDQRKLVDRAVGSPSGPVAWSINGLIAWGREDLTVWVVNADGSDSRQFLPAMTTAPSWSPDGTRLLFSAFDRAASAFEIMLANADGTDAVPLTSEGLNLSPAWSADGSQIVFSSFRDGEWQVYSMLADGSDQSPLTEFPGESKMPHSSH